tara:strand:- start:81289 stop:81531 length:243 start_codon:yes stop_codon:yes gene_type:complete
VIGIIAFNQKLTPLSFLSSTGKNNPQSELRATIKQLTMCWHGEKHTLEFYRLTCFARQWGILISGQMVLLPRSTRAGKEP